MHQQPYAPLPLLCAVLALSGCHSEDKVQPAPAQAPAPSTTSTTDLAQRLCEALYEKPAQRRAQCCGGTQPAPLLDECVRTLGASLQAHAVELRSGAVIACEAALDMQLTGCDWVGTATPPAPEACQDLLTGKVAEGGSCRSSLECVGSLHCAGMSPTQNGVCQTPGTVGASCGVQVDALATYTRERGVEARHPMCEGFCSLVNRKCETPPALGEACQVSVNCARGQSCTDGRCVAAEPVALARPGDACRTSFDCALGACVANAEGQKRCGAQCTAPLAALRAPNDAVVMRLPQRSRASAQ
jgi:hypothetical protein